MNLNQIDIKNFILTLFKRDDGERILLGAGAYSFKDDLQHFQPNIIANDVIEKQGTDGQLLAGQVRRCQTQTFNGYIGDASTTRERTEDYRRQFIQFFRTNHFYTAIYILPNGDAIQRRNGYLVEAPSVPEQYQRFPEYSVGMQFENLNYYTYNENDQGEETYAQTVDLIPEGNLTGGLTWDGDGVIWSDQGKALDQVLGDTFQQSYTGQNLLPPGSDMTSSGISTTWNNDGTLNIIGIATGAWPNLTLLPYALGAIIPSGTQLRLSITKPLPSGTTLWLREYNVGQTSYTNHSIPNGQTSQIFTTVGDMDRTGLRIRTTVGTALNVANLGVQLEIGSTATSFEPYVGGHPSPSPDFPQPIQTVTGTQTITINGTDYPLDLGDIELAEISTARDRIYKDGNDWKLHKTTGKATQDVSVLGIRLNQSSGATAVSEAGAFAIFNNIFPEIAAARASENLGIYKLEESIVGDAGANAMADGTFCQRQGTNDRLYFRNTSLIGKTGDEVKEILRTNSGGTNAWWPLETPTDTTITDQNLIAQLEAISEALKVGDRNISITATTGNLPAILVTKSVGIGGAIWDASGGHSTNIITVGGLFAVQPVWKIIGPAETPVLENITDGTSLSYIGSIPEGQTLTIDSSNQTAYLDGANVKNNVRGTWQQFQPGDVTIRYSGANVTKASTLEWNEVVG